MTLREACETVIEVGDLGLCNCDWSSLGLTGPETQTIMDDAANALARITHLPVGRCTTTYRPCRKGCSNFWCGCCGPEGIPLPGLNPTVTAVKIDGATVATSEYSVIRTANSFLLQRYDASGNFLAWPHTQNIAIADTQVATFAITVSAGTYPDFITRNAVGELACDALSHLVAERETDDGAVAATGYGVSLDYRTTVSQAQTATETLALAGLSWLRRFVAANGGARPAALWATELDYGWTLYERQ